MTNSEMINEIRSAADLLWQAQKHINKVVRGMPTDSVDTLLQSAYVLTDNADTLVQFAGILLQREEENADSK